MCLAGIKGRKEPPPGMNRKQKVNNEIAPCLFDRERFGIRFSAADFAGYVLNFSRRNRLARSTRFRQATRDMCCSLATSG